jgi:GTP-binding protein
MSNIVAIVGRPNVGKSTFFNRIVEKRQAIMDNMPGVTRDRHYGRGEWNGKFFTIIDTGGYVTGSEDKFESQIRKQVEMALEESTAVIFMVDCKDGITGYDREFANIIRRSKKPVFVAANKADMPGNTYIASEFYQLGLGEVFPISSSNGSGSGELLDEVVKSFPSEEVKDPFEGIPKIAILGRPNVGKSSLLNSLLGTERSIVTDEAGTTRDAIHTRYTQYGKDFILIDTAGIRKKAKVHNDVEFYSVLRSLSALEECDVCIVVIDAVRKLESQDVNIISQAEKMGKGIILFVNKWDLIEKDTKTADTFKKEINEALKPIDYLPIIFGSATEKQRIFQVMEKAVEVYNNKTQKVPTSALNDALLPEIQHYPPPAMKGKYIQIKYITQVVTATPTIVFFCNHPQYIIESYQRFLENRLREKFNFEGVPVRLFFRKK